MNGKYDIFISYRRDGGAQYARILQLMLIQRGYKVFLDYDELTDGIFSESIRAAIKEAPVFMLVLSKGSMQRCAHEGDWVREEITLAVEQKKHIIPINPDNGFDGFPEAMPESLKETIGSHQQSEISFGQALGATVDLLIKNRLAPTLGERSAQDHRDDNLAAAQETLHKQDAHSRFRKKMGIAVVSVVFLLALGTCFWFWRRHKLQEEISVMRAELQEKHRPFLLQLNADLSPDQMAAIDTLLQNMVEVSPNSIWMSQYEFTVGQWNEILGEPLEESQRYLPKVNVSFGEIYMLLVRLRDMTNIGFDLPSAEEWEFAARGGNHQTPTRYAGSDDPNAVAWYYDNSGGRAHPSNGQQGKEPNWLDLYDMSGNVSELCNSPFDDKGRYTLCGGSFASPAEEITVSSREGFETDAKDPRVGFRVIIRKP